MSKNFLNRFNSLDDFKSYLERLDKKNLAFDFKISHFEKVITQFIIAKVNSGGINNSPETASSIFLLLQNLAKRNNLFYSFKEGLDLLEQIKTEINQINYAELLYKYLAANTDFSVSFLQKKTSSHKKQTLLPETEYDAPQEPGHWREPMVGINKTYSFNPSQEIASVSERFSTNYLKKLFMWAFPWAIDVPPEKINTISKKTIKNLLELETTLPADIQFKTIQCLLLCLDGLGKACGKNGELSLKNYDDIKYIADISQLLDSDLKKLSNQKLLPEIFKKNLSRYITKLKEKDKELYDAKLHNTIMNNFCHTNERISAKNLALESKQSVLVPNMPEPVKIKKR